MKTRTLTFSFSLAFASLTTAQIANFPISSAKKICSYNGAKNVAGFSSPNNTTTDLYNKSACKYTVGIPENRMGAQDAAEGDYYYGIIAYYGDNKVDVNNLLTFESNAEVKGWDKYSEYIQLALPNGLAAGKDYEVSFKVSLSENSSFAISGLGVHFASSQLNEKNNQRLTVDPQVSFSKLVDDKNGWTELKESFKATGNEKYIVVGAFNKNFNTQKVSTSWNSRKAYYYISSIMVKEAPKPDSDKDGITDDMDKCPMVAGLDKFAGCPDTDGDGIQDSEDKCPKIAGTVAMNGCADSDKDGISDDMDKCPTIAGTKESMGCPEVSAKTKEVFEKALTGVQFESGKDVIKPVSFGILDNVAQIMNDNATYLLEINGHTDSQGDDAKNLDLSQRRSNAVKTYLSKKGVSANRMTPKGYGETVPIADNTTAVGRAKNRRVEFKVNF